MDRSKVLDLAVADRGFCDAKKRQGEGTCRKAAGWGTDHVGTGRCRLHGGNTRTQQTGAARAVGAALAKNLGGSVEVDPLDALLQALWLSAGAVGWLRVQVEDLDTGELHATVGGSEHGDGREEPHVYVRMYAEERDRMARNAKFCLEAGVAERQVRVVEAMGEALSGLLAAIFEGLELTPAQMKRAPEVVRRAMGQLELNPAIAA